MTTNHQAALDQAARQHRLAAEKVRRLEEQVLYFPRLKEALTYWRGLKVQAEAKLARHQQELLRRNGTGI